MGKPMSAPFTVFVCSTFDDLEQEREAVLDAIHRVQSRHNAMEFFGARPGRPIDVCLEEVRKSDLLVVIVGEKYGSLPSGMGISYSQAEYEEGFVRLKKPCLVYLRDDDVPILKKYVEHDPEAWKQTLNAKHTVAKFEDWPRLAVQVAADVGNLLVVRATADAKGVSEAPLREVLKRLGETEVPEAEIPDRLAKAADELIRLRADLARLSNDRPEFTAIRARASALIDKGDFDGARVALNEGRQAARALREEASRTEAGFLADEARVDRLQLNYDAACRKFAEAARLDPDKVWIWIELGDLWRIRGSLVEAKKVFSAARDAAVRSGTDRDRAVAHERIGDVHVAQGDLVAALRSHNESLVIRDRLAKSDRGNVGSQYDLGISNERIGDMQMAQGDLAGALTSYRAKFAIIDRLATSDPGNTGWQRDLSVAHNKIGDVGDAQGDLARALTSYRDGLTIIDRLAKADPNNAQWQYDLGISNERIGDAQVAHGDLAGALNSYRAKFAVVDRLAQSDPGNAGWRRDLTVSYEKIGNVQLARGDLAGALKSYRDSLAIRDRLAKSDPGNYGWRRELSVSCEKIGDVQVAQADLAGALKSYRDSLAIMDPLTTSNPDNAEWQRHVAVSHSKIASTLTKIGNRADALDALRRGNAIMVRLTALSPDNAEWKRNLVWFEARIAELSQ
jgi:tetratricopeptide (TPR) repeat protein